MAEITTGRIDGTHVILDERLTNLDGKHVRITVEPIVGAPHGMRDEEPFAREASPGEHDVVARWSAIPDELARAVAGLTDEELDRRGAPDGMSIREIAHHLAEAAVVASAIVVGAVGSGGRPFDWSWMVPNMEWTRRMGYATLPVGPAVAALRALTAHLRPLLETAGRLESGVALVDTPGAEPRTTTVEGVLRDEIRHAADHLEELRAIRDGSAGG
jgi:hypothetical protein